MNNSDLHNKGEVQNLKDIPKWTRRYAQSRTIPFLISMIVFMAVFLGIGGSSYLGGNAYRSGNMVGFWLCMAVLAPSLLSCIWFSIPSCGGKTIERISKRYYDKEGDVALAVPKSGVDYIVGGLFAACILFSVFLGGLGYFSTEYMQPISALYLVPFLVYLVWRQRRSSGWLPLLWPALFALHAILIVVGAPILFQGKWQPLNMAIPTIGYGLLCGLIGHAYNRYALRKLRGFAVAKE